MNHNQCIKASRQQKLTDANKFDRHMIRARMGDMDSRKAIFDQQTINGIERAEAIENIKPSIY